MQLISNRTILARAFVAQRPVICSSFSGYLAPCTVILEARSRWSPLAFSERAVEPEKLCSVLEATALGLFIHQMAGFDVPKTKEVYGIPNGYEPVEAIALGYLGNPEILSEKLLQRDLLHARANL